MASDKSMGRSRKNKRTKQNTQRHKTCVTKTQKTQILGCRTPLDNRKFVSDTNKDGILLWGQISAFSRGTPKANQPLKSIFVTNCFFLHLVYTFYYQYIPVATCRGQKLSLVAPHVSRIGSTFTVPVPRGKRTSLLPFGGFIELANGRFLSTDGRVLRLL